MGFLPTLRNVDGKPNCYDITGGYPRNTRPGSENALLIESGSVSVLAHTLCDSVNTGDSPLAHQSRPSSPPWLPATSSARWTRPPSWPTSGDPALAASLGGRVDALSVKEVGDGNLNFVYIVTSDAGSVVVKQALPYIRCVGDSWPMTRERAYFEASALREHGRLCPDHVPEVYHFDRAMSLIGMRYIKPPHIILRKGLIAGVHYPLLAHHMADYMANTSSSPPPLQLHHPPQETRFAALLCSPLLNFFCLLATARTWRCAGSRSRSCSRTHTWSPNTIAGTRCLDKDAEAVREDDGLKLEIAELKSMFIERAQALIHGDLHTGSIMDGHADQANDRKAYKQWILKTIEESWNLFQQKFLGLWNKHKDGNGEAYLPAIYNNPELLGVVQKMYMTDLLHDSLGFGSAKMIRRIVGIAHVEDFDSIEDASKRASCERHIDCAKAILKGRRQFESIEQVIARPISNS
ncbi:hypothetical protein ZWY2020_059436 [Hordeum vulgare]|nr:hypothetical protein ZWY2020_059436 [Hordeum vulgare]